MVRLTDIDRWGLYPAPDESSPDVDQHHDRDRDRQAKGAVNKRSGHQRPMRNHPPSDSLPTPRFRSTRENLSVDTDDEPLPVSRERFVPVQKQREATPQSAGHPQWSLIDADDDIYELIEVPQVSNVTSLPGDTAANDQLSDVQHPTSGRDRHFRGPASDIDFTTPSPIQTPILNAASDVDFTTPSPIQTPTLNAASDVDFTTPSPIQSPILNPTGSLGKRTASSNEPVANKRRLCVTQQAQKILSSPLTDNLDAKPYSLMSARYDDFSDHGTRARQSSIAPFLSTRISGRTDSAAAMPDDEQSQDAQSSKNTQDDSGMLNFDLDLPYNFLETSQDAIDPTLITGPTLEEQEAGAKKSRMLREKAWGRASNLNVAMSTNDSTTPDSHPDQPPSDSYESTSQASSPGIDGDTRHVEEEGHSENQVNRHPQESDATFNDETPLNDIRQSQESNAPDNETLLNDIRRSQESHSTNNDAPLNEMRRPVPRPHESHATNLEKHLNDLQRSHESNASARETHLKDIRRSHESNSTHFERPLSDIRRPHKSNNAADRQTHLNDIGRPQGSQPKYHDAPMNDIRPPPPRESHATNHDIRRPRPPERHATDHGPSLKDIQQPHPHESYATNHDIRRPQGSHPNDRDVPVNDIRRPESHATNNDAPLNNNQQRHRKSSTADHGTHLINIRRPHEGGATERERPLNDIHPTTATGKANDIHPTTATREASDVHSTPKTANVAPRPSGFEMLASRRGNHFWSTNDHRGAALAPVAVTHPDNGKTPSKQKAPFGTRIPTQVADNLTEELPNASPVKETEQRLNHRLPLMNRNEGTRQATRAPDVSDRPAREITLGEHNQSQDRPREVGGSSIEIARDAVELTLPHKFDTWSEEAQQIIREHEIAKEANRDLEALFLAVDRIAQLRSFGYLKAIEEKELYSVQQFLDLVGRRKLSGKRQRPDISKISSRMRQRVTATGGSLPTPNVVEQNIALLFPIEDIQDARNQMADLRAKIERLGAKRQNVSRSRACPSIQVTANRDENRESEDSQNLDIPVNIPVNASRHSRTPQVETLRTPFAPAVRPPPFSPSPPPPAPAAAPQIRGSQGFDQDLLDRMRKQSLARQSQPEENQSDEEDEAASSTAETTTESDDDEADSDSDGETSGPRELFEYTVSSIYAGVEDYDSGDEYICLKTTDMKKANQKVDKLATEFEKKYPPEEGLHFGRRSNRSSWENGLVERYVSLGEDEVREARFFVKRQIASVARSAYRIARTQDPVISRIFYKVEWEKVTEYEQQQEQEQEEEGEAHQDINWGPPERSTIPLHEILSFTTSAQANRHAADVWLAWYFRYFPGLEMERQRRLDAEEIERELEMKADFGLFAKEDSFYSGQVPENDGDGGELETPLRVRETFKIWVRKDHVYGPPN